MRDSPGDDDRVDDDEADEVDDDDAGRDTSAHPGASRTDQASPAEFIDAPANEPGDDDPPSSS